MYHYGSATKGKSDLLNQAKKIKTRMEESCGGTPEPGCSKNNGKKGLLKLI
jgi:hypothetical protein